MARTPNPVQAPVEVKFNEAAFERAEGAATELAQIHDEQRQATRALALQLNYQGSLEPGVLENSARDAIRRIGAGIFELGGYLLLLKEAVGHGEFLPALERLGLGVSSAGRYMAVTRRFANSATSRNLELIGMSKLVELLPLDDEQLDDLTELGVTGELAFDDVARMSVKELRQAVRKERNVNGRLAEVNQELNAENVRMKLDSKVVAMTDWPAALEPVSEQIAAAGRQLAMSISALETCRITIFASGQNLADHERLSFEAALHHVGGLYQEALERAERLLERERLTFDQTLGNFDGTAA